jgi:ammonium transporter, Amt family
MHRGTRVARGALAAAAAALLLAPAAASADTLEAYSNGALSESVAINTMWVVVAGCLVMFMQAGFAFLEIGFSRGKNAGTVIAKILVNFSIAAVMYWAIGFAFAFGPGDIIGSDGFFLRDFGDPLETFSVMGLSNATIESKWFFQFVFCAVSLAIVWGTTLERIKFGVYIIYAIVFAGVIYPIGSHWVFGGGWLQANIGMQDFAGSTAVHMIGATGALAVLLLLGPRRGKYGRDGKPRAIPGHNMPLFGLGVLILWLGWFGFNPGSTLNAEDGRFPEILIVTQMAAAAGVITAIITAAWKTKSIDIGMAGNGAIGALVAITAPSGYVELWTAPIIGGIAGVIVPLSIYAIDKKIDDPVGALSAHGIAGIWGTLSCGFFTSPRLAQYNAFGDPDGGLIYSGALTQLWYQALGIVVVFAFVFSLSFLTFWAIKQTYGLRVTSEEEEAGLDISEHGMYGYPEQFIPAPELVGYATAPGGSRDVPRPAPTTREVPAS